MRQHVDIPLRYPPDAARAPQFTLELEVACRADEWVRQRSAMPGLSLCCWMLAEAEILGLRKASPPQFVAASRSGAPLDP